MASPLQLEVAHSVLYVHDRASMISFYSDVLGFEVTDRGPLMAADGPEIIFMSQVANHHHQVAFISGRPEPKPSNNTHHTAYRSSGTLDDLKTLKKSLEADARVTEIMPLCHGNAWSIYFKDPEFNGVEVFIDTPWHVKQPQGKPLDFDLSNDEIIEYTKAAFGDEPEFGPIGEFYQKRSDYLAD